MHRLGKDGLGAAYLAGFQWGLERNYDYGSRGRLLTDALWLQRLWDEDAQSLGEGAATVLMDLAKAFESTRLDEAWRRGLLLKAPLTLLRLALELCTFCRHLSYHGCVDGTGVSSLSTVLAGTSFAVDVLF